MKKTLTFVFLFFIFFLQLQGCSTIPDEWKGLNLNDQSIREITRQDNTSFSFAVVGDSRENIADYSEVISMINEQIPPPLFVIHLGDLVKNGSIEEYANFMDITGNLNTPFLAVAGNHDLRNKGKKFFINLFGPLNYFFDYKDNRFIVLDDVTEGKKGLSDEQVWWLNYALKKAKKKNKFIFMHIPPSVGHITSDYSKNMNRFISTLKKYNNVYVFCGHIHDYDKFKYKGINFFISGGGGANIGKRSLTFGGHFKHFLVVDVDGNKVRDKVVRLDDE